MQFPGVSLSKRKPFGYYGRQHQTIGADILAILDALTMPRAILGEAIVDQLDVVQASQWYDINKLTDVLDLLEAGVGTIGLRRIGRALFRRTHQEAFMKVATSAKDVVFGIDGMYKRANRGRDIGGWRVIKYEVGYAQLEKTTPHHCAMEEGILDGALLAVGASSTVTQSRCFRQGADRCIFELHSNTGGKGWAL